MTNEERDLITRFIERAAGVQGASFGGQGQGQAPAQPLPPIDHDADALIGDLFARHPEARYRITQMAFVQEQALVAAQARINALQSQLQQMQAAQQSGQAGGSPWSQPQSSSRGGGLFGGLFGGGRSAAPPPPPPQYAPPPPQPQYAPGYSPGMFQQQGSGFLGTALRTATGVAGGILAADALSSLFSGHHDGGGLIGSAQAAEPIGGGVSSPWGAPADQGGFANPQGPDPFDAGGAPKDFDTGAGGGGVDQSAWTPDPGTDQGSGWQDASDQGGGGFDFGGGDAGGGWDDTNT